MERSSSRGSRESGFLIHCFVQRQDNNIKMHVHLSFVAVLILVGYAAEGKQWNSKLAASGNAPFASSSSSTSSSSSSSSSASLSSLGKKRGEKLLGRISRHRGGQQQQRQELVHKDTNTDHNVDDDVRTQITTTLTDSGQTLAHNNKTNNHIIMLTMLSFLKLSSHSRQELIRHT